jgi:hypothetical protein
MNLAPWPAGRGGFVAVLIPALDEEAALPLVLTAIPREAVGSVIVVDNGSTDRTAHVAREAGATVIHEPRRGYGAACLAGLAALRQRPPRSSRFSTPTAAPIRPSCRGCSSRFSPATPSS